MAMFDSDTLKATVEVFLSAARASEDSAYPGLAERIDDLDAAFSSWVAAGAALPRAEALLRAASNVQTGFHALNTEGLPRPIRDPSAEMLALIDMAEENGFSVTEHDTDWVDAPSP